MVLNLDGHVTTVLCLFEKVVQVNERLTCSKGMIHGEALHVFQLQLISKQAYLKGKSDSQS